MIIKDGKTKYEFRMVPNTNKKKGSPKDDSPNSNKKKGSPDFFCFFDIPGTAGKDGTCKQLKISLWKQQSKGGKEYYTGMEMLEDKGK